MSSSQPRAFTAATSVLAFAQAFTTASVRSDDEAVRPRRTGRRAASVFRAHRAGR